MVNKSSSINLIYSLNKLKQISDDFLKQLELALENKPSNLSNLETPIPHSQLIANNESFQVISIGGSIFKSAEIKYENNQIKILKETESQVPMFDNDEIFLNFIKKNILPNIKILSLNLAFPLKSIIRNNILDGILIEGRKEHQFKNLINKPIGQTVEKYVNKFGKNITVTVANDSVCLMLAGLINHDWQNLIGGVVGTGINFCLMKNQNTIINLESGNFKINQEIIEKQISGAYLYQYSHPAVKNTTELSALAEKNITGSEYARNLFEHSASLIACQIAAIYKFKKQPILNFIIEGNLFWQGYHYRETIFKYLSKLIDNYQEQSIKFIKIKSSNLIGASQLVISNN